MTVCSRCTRYFFVKKKGKFSSFSPKKATRGGTSRLNSAMGVLFFAISYFKIAFRHFCRQHNSNSNSNEQTESASIDSCFLVSTQMRSKILSNKLGNWYKTQHITWHLAFLLGWHNSDIIGILLRMFFCIACKMPRYNGHLAKSWFFQFNHNCV